MPFIRRVKKKPANDEANQKIVLLGQPELATPTPAKEPATPTPTKKAKESRKPATEWKPGLTEKGERMLAMAPIETTDVLRNPIITRCLFLIEKKGQRNPIAFKDAADVREKAARGYLK
ncbi:hypothetical protein K469DRAFT_692021 [Zopfia rhizophila CBS 207.26]|uniref:Uncharacterized protein n=1 Tax=Zopfia rhizophila CBS 207.26 TaxID=1314779 RepID=A0A6A6DR94_9PEZI|nr:hypothetical protein K469DRAFT_692021 [Zopfia rhizophila CBS 207.26]